MYEYEDYYHENEPDWDEICPYGHKNTRVMLYELIDALYTEDTINNEFIEEKIFELAQTYNVLIPKRELKLRREA